MFNIFNGIYFKKRRVLILFLIFLVVISTVSVVSAVGRTIGPASPGGLFEAIESAENGDTVYLENGIYTGYYNVEMGIDKNITIQGKGKNVVIDGENKYSYLFQMVKQDTVNKFMPVSVNLINLKIKNFNGDVIDNWGSLKVTNCTFSDNKISGAIIGNYDDSSCKIANSVFSKNTFIYNKSVNTAGIAIYNDNVAILSVTGSSFTNFKSTKYSAGVAIANFGSSNILISKYRSF